MPLSSDMWVVGVVILARLVVPLFIPRFPLPAILACLVVDGVDQTVFQTFTKLNLDWYQSYDKALDIYYLVIAYLSTLRNWRSRPAFTISRFLFYYRLAGVAAFELTGWRALLLVFPNVFEYFYIYYEGLRTRWNPLRFSRRYWLIVAAAIWAFVKLPQEWWLHVARLDTTDIINQKLFGVSAEAGIAAGIAHRPFVAAGLLALLVVLALAVRWLLIPRLPPRITAGPSPRNGCRNGPTRPRNGGRCFFAPGGRWIGPCSKRSCWWRWSA